MASGLAEIHITRCKSLRVQIVTKKVGQVFEADIRSYFTRINHQWLREMVAQRIADPVILRLIGKWLNAGAMQDGVVTYAEEGTPQGGSISPVLSNLYLHFVLDLWFEKKIKPQCRGEAYLVRFADDFVVSFQYRQDVDHFQQQVRERFAKFGLELAEEKTRRIFFGRFADLTCQRHGLGRPETFEFLGFKHVCGVDRKGRFALIRIPSAKSCRKFLARTREWIFRKRSSNPSIQPGKAVLKCGYGSPDERSHSTTADAGRDSADCRGVCNQRHATE